LRIAEYGPFRGLIKFDRNSLIEVYFGYRTSPESQEKINSLLSQNGYRNTQVYEMKPKKDDFGFVILRAGQDETFENFW
jgi:hypothetical protein